MPKQKKQVKQLPKDSDKVDHRLSENRTKGLNMDGSKDKRIKNKVEAQSSMSKTIGKVSGNSSKDPTKDYRRVENRDFGYNKDGTRDQRVKNDREAVEKYFAGKPKQSSTTKDFQGYSGKKTAEGRPDMRTNEGKSYMNNSNNNSSSLYSGKITKSGNPDMRTNEAKSYISNQPSSYKPPQSTYQNTSSASSSYTGKVTKSGNPDMRTNAAKDYVHNTSSYSISSSLGGGGGNSYSYGSGGGGGSSSYSSGGGGGGLSGYSGRVTASGRPDMRTSAGKAWAASNK